jgi:hypothetical protein
VTSNTIRLQPVRSLATGCQLFILSVIESPSTSSVLSFPWSPSFRYSFPSGRHYIFGILSSARYRWCVFGLFPLSQIAQISGTVAIVLGRISDIPHVTPLSKNFSVPFFRYSSFQYVHTILTV